VVYSLAASHKIGIAVIAGCFILFALASALWLPRLRPDFPTRSGLGWYMGVVVTFAAGTLIAVVLLAAEPKEKAEAAKPGPSTGTGKTTGAKPPSGNPAAGKQLFTANGCGSCHTFAPAKATGKIGPDLDKLAADAQKAGRGSEQQYAFESISDPNAYVVPGFAQGVMPNFGARLSKTQIDDLVAFITQKS
jgi:mono/diheme cytochrome c family protein